MTRTSQKTGTADSTNGNTLFCDAPSYFGAAEGMCLLVRHFLRQHELPELAFATELVVRECLNNAISHGNRSDPRKRIRLSVAADTGTVYVRVEDEGCGFQWRTYETSGLPSHTAPSGRGLAVIRSYARHVQFNRKGNVIRVEIAANGRKRGKQ